MPSPRKCKTQETRKRPRISDLRAQIRDLQGLLSESRHREAKAEIAIKGLIKELEDSKATTSRAAGERDRLQFLESDCHRMLDQIPNTFAQPSESDFSYTALRTNKRVPVRLDLRIASLVGALNALAEERRREEQQTTTIIPPISGAAMDHALDAATYLITPIHKENRQ